MTSTPALQGFGLSDLPRVPLRPEHEEALRRAREVTLGEGAWRHCKLSTVRDLFALEQISERMEVIAIDPSTELRAIVRLRCAVPCLPPGATDLVVEDEVELALHLPEEILRGPLPGYALVEILKPFHVHHANVSSGPSQRLCLGANVPRSYPLREAVLASYGAVTMQSVTLDTRDPAGLMNAEAADWWQQNLHRIPLSRVPFLAPLTADAKRDCARGESS